MQMTAKPFRDVPLSIAQRSMWVSDKISPADVIFNLAEYVEFFTPLEPQLFVAAVKQVAEEADPWRTQIIETGSGPVQRIAAAGYREVPYFDYSDRLTPVEDALAWMQAELARPTDPSVDPLWCCVLFKIDSARFFWYHRSHHAILDGFGAGLLSRRVAEIYNALAAGETPSASPFLPVERQLEAEQHYLNSPRHQRDQQYWHARLANLPEAPSLALSGGRPQGGLRRSSLQLSREQYRQLKAGTQGSGYSLPQRLIALLASYIYRLTGVEDLLILMPVSARSGASQRSIPGMFANAVALRLIMSAAQDNETLLGQVAGAVRAALRHQQYRYESLRRELGLLAQGRQIAWLGINIEPFDYRIGLGGGECAIHNLSNGTIDDLTFFVYDRGDEGGLRIDIDGNPGLYSQQQLDAHRDRLTLMVEHFLAEPHTPLNRLPLMSPEDSRRLVATWNDSARPLPGDLIASFEAMVQRQPEAPALHWPGGCLSYRELNQQANRVAHTLAREGVGQGDLVGVLVPREPMLLVTLLGILKAGAVYLPLDPAAPAPRQQQILTDADPALLIGHRRIPVPPCRARVLYADDLALSDAADANPCGGPGLAAPAYVIYTSGSTGQPKGVVVTRGNLANFLMGIREVVPLTPQDRLLAMTTIAFDIAALELYLPLVCGAQVVMCDRDSARDPEQVAAMLKQFAVTVVQATPSHWRALLPSARAGLARVRALVGGEALPGELAAQLNQAAAQVINLYGPTETTIWSTAMVLDAANLAAPPIGRPLANTQVYVVDPGLGLAPVGAVGELCIGGDGVARGYWRQPTLTRARFIDNPFGPGRLYRTGDMVRWRPDGVLEYLGRNDFQIKVRGYRVEADDIAQHLASCEGVAQAVVTLRQDPAGHSRLVAYYLCDGAARPAAAALRRALAARLPDYMVPSHFEPVDQFPLNINGKLDRNGLPEPHWQVCTDVQAPRNALEAAIAAIWQEIFEQPVLSVHTGFFDLGGDSLMAARLAIRLRETLARDIPLVVMFEADTIAKLADRLDRLDPIDPLATLITLREEEGGPRLFCVHPVVGLGWAFGALLPHLPGNVSVYALQSPGLSAVCGGSPPVPPATLAALAELYIEHIRAKQAVGPYRLLGWSMGGSIVYEMARQLVGAGETVDIVALLDAYPFVQAVGAEPQQRSLVASAMTFLNIAPEPGECGPETLDQLAEFLCRKYDVGNAPVVADTLRRDPDFLVRLRAVVERNLALLRAYVPGFLAANLLFFEASEGARDTSGVIEHRPDIWSKNLDGVVERVAVPCHHQAMLDPEPARQIGRLIGARLGALAARE